MCMNHGIGNLHALHSNGGNLRCEHLIAALVSSWYQELENNMGSSSIMEWLRISVNYVYKGTALSALDFSFCQITKRQNSINAWSICSSFPAFFLDRRSGLMNQFSSSSVLTITQVVSWVSM